MDALFIIMAIVVLCSMVFPPLGAMIIFAVAAFLQGVHEIARLHPGYFFATLIIAMVCGTLIIIF